MIPAGSQTQCSTPGQSAPWTTVQRRWKHSSTVWKTAPLHLPPAPARHLCLSNKFNALDDEDFPPLAEFTLVPVSGQFLMYTCCHLVTSSGDVSFHSYVDDIQLCIAVSPDDLGPFNCILDIMSLMAHNFLQLNQYKTEVLIIGSETQRKYKKKLQDLALKPSQRVKNLVLYLILLLVLILTSKT